MDLIKDIFPLVLIVGGGIALWIFWGKGAWAKHKAKEVKADPIAPTLADVALNPSTYGQVIAPDPLVTGRVIWTSGTSAGADIAKQVADTRSIVPPARTMPDAFYTSIEALLLDLRGLRFTHQVVLDGHYIWPIGQAGFRPPLTYATIGGSLVQVNGAPGITPPVTPTLPPPVPVTPTPPPAPPAPKVFVLTADEIRAGVQPVPPFGAKTDGERFPSNEHRAAWVAAVLGQGTAPAPTEPAQTYADTRGWNHFHWLWFLEHPEVWPQVENTLYNNQMKNAHSQGGPLNTGGEAVRPPNI